MSENDSVQDALSKMEKWVKDHLSSNQTPPEPFDNFCFQQQFDSSGILNGLSESEDRSFPCAQAMATVRSHVTEKWVVSCLSTHGNKLSGLHTPSDFDKKQLQDAVGSSGILDSFDDDDAQLIREEAPVDI